MTDLKHLGKQSRDPVETLDLIPWKGGKITVTLNATEFTSHCPVTQQPDFGTLEIEYVPLGSLVETKSFKLFLYRWRDRAAFNEAIVDEIAQSFFDQVNPRWVRVAGRFNVRGGISVTPVAERNATQA